MIIKNNVLEKISYVFIDFIKCRTDKKYRIIKKTNKMIKSIIIPEEIKNINKNVNLDNIGEEFKPCIEEFIKVLNDNFDEELLNNFYHNLRTLKIVRKNSKYYDSKGIEGIYDYDSNTIFIYNNKYDKTIFHELFHMASSNIISKQRKFIGFHQYTSLLGTLDIGKGINEGYTEYLTQELFGENNRCGYNFEVFMASYTEAIIGCDKIAKYYLKADLKGLINEMSKYEKKENVYTFLRGLDYYNRNCRDKKVRENVCLCVDYCINFIFTSYLNHLRYMYDNNFMSKDDVIENIICVYNDMSFDLFDCNEHFELNFDIFVDNVDKVFNDILDVKEVII